MVSSIDPKTARRDAFAFNYFVFFYDKGVSISTVKRVRVRQD